MGYIDPGLFGTVSQIGLAFLFIVTTSFTLLFKPIKKVFQSFTKRKSNPHSSEN